MTLLALLLAASCGSELRAVKSLTDKEAAQVDLRPQGSTIAAMRALKAPPMPRPATRQPSESKAVSIAADVIAYKLEADGDYHVVLADEAGRTIIAEFPDPNCASASRALREITAARAKFNSLLAKRGLPRPGSKLRRPKPFTVWIKGVVFFDKVHGQAGVAPNGIELHPVLLIGEPK